MKILLVEDEPHLAAQVQRALARAGHEINHVDDGLAAVEAAGGANLTGVIFRLSASGTYSVVAEFGTSGPRIPRGGLVLGLDGLLYGTTSAGGAADAGTVIQIDPATNLWSVVGEFTGTGGAAPGAAPAGELTVASDGTVYGMAAGGGASGFGSVFRYLAGTGLETLVSLTGAAGAAPGVVAADLGSGIEWTGGVAAGADGTLCVVAAGGGSGGGGVAFTLTVPSPIVAWKQAMLGDPDAPDDGDPDFAGVINLVEYALGMNPAAADASSQPQAVSQDPRNSLTNNDFHQIHIFLRQFQPSRYP